ncbi:Ff.00g053970.m01.CDS01 [Fusarium sp. VM40]|nr:Ff.00g053970.m01.CDS01 [Fusarium sp. VM40]
MSGFELAGVILGAFPIAISTLNAGFEQYGTVARKLKLFYAFKSEHKKYRDELKFNQLMFNANLRRLLLPLVVSDDKIEVLLADPGGPEWSQRELDNHLQRRLKHSYTLFLDYMINIKEIIVDLNRQLTIVGEAAKDKANHATLSLKERVLATLSKENREFLLYKAGFTNAEPARKRLLDDMRDCIEKLERLLSSNDEEARLTEQKKTSHQKLSDTAAICNFWKYAVRLLRALASSSSCNCRPTHSAELLLQHRTGDGTEFWIDFVTSDYSKWEIFKTKITESNEIITTQLQDTAKFLEKTSVRQPNHRQLNPMRSALKSSTLSTTTQVTRYVILRSYPDFVKTYIV